MKTIHRRVVGFKKNKDKYQCVMLMQGYEFDNNEKGVLLSEVLPLFEIFEDDLFKTAQLFIDQGYDIEVKDDLPKPD